MTEWFRPVGRFWWGSFITPNEGHRSNGDKWLCHLTVEGKIGLQSRYTLDFLHVLLSLINRSEIQSIHTSLAYSYKDEPTGWDKYTVRTLVVGKGPVKVYILYEHRAACLRRRLIMMTWYRRHISFIHNFTVFNFVRILNSLPCKLFKGCRWWRWTHNCWRKKWKKWQHSNSCRTKRRHENEMWQLWPQSPNVTNLLESAFSSASFGFPWLFSRVLPIFLMSTPALTPSSAHPDHINSNHLQHKSLVFFSTLYPFVDEPSW